MTSFKKGNVTFHVIVSEHEANKQEGTKLFMKLGKLFTANGIDKKNLLIALSDLLRG